MRRLSRPLVGRLSTLATIEEDSGDSRLLQEGKKRIVSPQDKENELPESLVALLDATYEAEVRRASLPPLNTDLSLNSLSVERARVMVGSNVVPKRAQPIKTPAHPSRTIPRPCSIPSTTITNKRTTLVHDCQSSVVQNKPRRKRSSLGNHSVRNSLVGSGALKSSDSFLGSLKPNYQRLSLNCTPVLSKSITATSISLQTQPPLRRHTLMEIPAHSSVLPQPNISRRSSLQPNSANTKANKRIQCKTPRVSLKPRPTNSELCSKSQSQSHKTPRAIKQSSEANFSKSVSVQQVQAQPSVVRIPSYLRPTKASLAKAKVRK